MESLRSGAYLLYLDILTKKRSEILHKLIVEASAIKDLKNLITFSKGLEFKAEFYLVVVFC